MTDLTLTCRRTIAASPEAIYNAWLDPATITQFMCPGPNTHVREARSDARVGGDFFLMMVGDKEYPHSGTYKALTPYSRLAFSWESPHSAPESLVEIDLKPVAGGTEVVLTHTRFLSEESRDNHTQGWTAILEKLDGLVGQSQKVN